MSFSLLSFLQDVDPKYGAFWDFKRFNRGDIIIQEGSVGQELFLVSEGMVHIRSTIALNDTIAEDKNIARVSKGEVFGELSLFDESVRTATAMAACDDCEIFAIDGAALLVYMDENPEKGYQVLSFFFKQMAERMRQTNIRANAVLGFYMRECAEDEGDE